MNLMNNEKHYNTINNYYKHVFGNKIMKISLNGDFTCPNKDGLVGFGGCSFCSSLGSGDFAGKKDESLKVQFQKQVNMMKQKWDNAKYIVYFQANTNTYGPLAKIKKLFDEAITLDPNIIMISIATRPDAISNEVLDYLAELNKKIKVQVELGLQTIHEKTAKSFNRGYSLEVFIDAVDRLKKREIEVVVHIINGLPNETKEMMIDTVKFLNSVNINGIKIHILHLMKNTKMGNEYLENPWHILSLNEYVDIVTNQILWLKKDIIIHRLTGDSPKEMLIAPTWTLKKFVTINEIDKELRRLNLYQGDYYEKFNN